MTEKQTVTCCNSGKTSRKYGELLFADECRGCSLLYTHLNSEGRTGDIVRCGSPIPLKYGDKVEITPEQVKRFS